MYKSNDTIIHWLDFSSYEDLRFFEIGYQKCYPNYGYGPIIRDKYILHYVLSGSGKLQLNGKITPVHSKQAFIIPPGVPGYYEADTSNPWTYIWIQFHGPKAAEMLEKAGITGKSPIFTPNGSYQDIEECLWNIINEPDAEYACMGRLYEFFQLLIYHSSQAPKAGEKTDSSLEYVHRVIHYISEKYSEPIHIQEIADYCGLDRAYLSKLFKGATGLTPQRYLINYRIDKAKQLLKNTNLPIQHVSYSVGYSDPLAFSKFFRQETGTSPTEYRKLM